MTRREKAIVLVLSASSWLCHALVIGSAFGLTLFTHPQIDDLFRSAQVRNLGLRGAIVFEYTHWAGRWLGTGISYLLDTTGDIRRSYSFGLLAVHVLFVGSLYCLIRRLVRGVSAAVALAMSLALLEIYWTGVPHPGQTFYWMTGAVEQHLGLGIPMVVMALLWRAGDGGRAAGWSAARVLRLGLLAALAFGAPAMHELYGAMFVGLLLLGAALSFRAGSAARYEWAATAVAATAGWLVVYVAPGNAVRMAMVPAGTARSLPRAVRLTSKQLVDYLPGWVLDLRLLSASLLVLLHPKLRPVPPDWLTPWRWLPPLCTAGLLCGGIATHAWITGATMEVRTAAAFYILFLLGWFATLLAWAPLALAPLAPGGRASTWTLAAAGVLFALSVAAAPTSRTGYADLLSRAPKYDAAMKWRYRILDAVVARRGTHATIPRLSVEPALFFHADYTNEAIDHRHYHTLMFYKLTSLDMVPLHAWHSSGELQRVAPCRLGESRAPAGLLLRANGDTSLAATGVCGVPGDAKALALNVTVTGATAEGDLRLSSDAQPSETIHFLAHRPMSHETKVALGAEGRIHLGCEMATPSAGAASAVVIVYGYYL